MSEQVPERQCPKCKETIRADAIKCRHCGSKVSPTWPEKKKTSPVVGLAITAIIVVVFIVFAVVSPDRSGELGRSKSWAKPLCLRTLAAYAASPRGILPSYIRITCKDVLERGIVGAKWRNEAQQCAPYSGEKLVICMDEVFK